MEYQRRNQGVCSHATRVVIEDGVIRQAEILGGCDGNIKGVCELIKGMNAQEAAQRLEGITCGRRPTSCPDQLSKALKEAMAQGEKASA